MSQTHADAVVDAVIVGAGFSGLYATHRLRNLQGLTVQCFEAAGGPGGVWYWNRDPGARCDFESIHYSYTFDEDLQREWRWTERHAAQPEILAYLEHVADRFDVRRSYRFNTRITSVVWDDAAGNWVVSTDDGAVTAARYFINAAGSFSAFKKNDFPGQGEFRGTVLHTSHWPADGVELTQRRNRLSRPARRYSRIGHHGGAAGRFIDAHDFVVASSFQHDSRDHDPQLHIHNAILNRVQGSDGTWRTLDSRAIHRFRGGGGGGADDGGAHRPLRRGDRRRAPRALGP